MAGRGSRLLDALDSFSNPTPRTPMTPINVEVGSSSTPDASQSKMALMQARLTQEQGKLGFARHAESVDDDVDFVFGSQSGSSTSRAFPAGPKVAGGFRLNYDIETPVRSIDLGGADQEEKIAEFVTKGIDNASHGITVQRGMEALGLEDKEDILPGMDVRLLDHQAIGVAWMLEKERGQDRGGILADDMGLGKTVQMIATMAMNQPAIDEENTCKTTLIVVPAALLQQWKDEILEKTNGIWTVHVHHGKDKLKKKSEVKSFDMIVTTYHTLMNDFVIPKDVEPAEEAAWLAKNGGILARIKFYRAIADEAQYIRNRGTKASMALAHVQAKYRWMLTGTPVTNTLADIYGLLRFGKFRPWNDWNSFNEYVARVQVEDAPLAGQRAQTILSPILLRRTKDSQLEGKPILDLKPKVIELVRIPFSEDERDIYDSFEQSSKIQVNKFINEKSLVKNHHFVLVMILRLRQLCCHPHLILSQTEDYADPTVLMGGDGEKERARALKAKGKVWVDKVKQRLLIRARADNVFDFADELDDATCPVCDEAFVEDKGRILGCGHEVCSECVLDIRNSAIEHNGIFGEGNEKENMEIERKFEEANAKGWRPCPTCKSMQDLSEAKIFKLDAFQPTEEELAKFVAESRQARRKKTKKAVKYESSDDESEGGPTNKTLEEKGLDDSDDDFPELADIMRPMKKQKIEETKDDDDDEIVDLTLDQVSAPLKTPSHNSSSSNAKKRKSPGSTSNSASKSKGRPKKGTDLGNDGPSDAIIAAWSKGDDDLEASAKMIKLIKYLKEWEAIGDKTIVYSQWTSMLDLIETLFSRHGVRSVRYDGKMDRISREHALAVFKRPDGPKVILISTRSGGVGLNLVAANRIVNMDLSWNYAAESQAYDRAHRIGQNKTVFVKRLVIENTIEDRLLQLQEVKVGLAEAALGEGTGTKLKKLSMRDIKFLFGMTKKAPSQSQDQGSDDGEE